MATNNVSVLRTGTGWTIDVTAANLDSDLSIKDFVVLHNGVLYTLLNNYTKTTRTVLTYTGLALPNNTLIELRRDTPTSVIQPVQFGTKMSSDLWNKELDRKTRWQEDIELNGVNFNLSLGSSIKVFSSIQDMRTSSVSVTTGLLLGYHVPGDEGGGHFYFDATSQENDNGGTVIKPSSLAVGRWKRIFDKSKVNITWFGARGQSHIEDTAAINKALLVGNAFVPKGTFLLTHSYVPYRYEQTQQNPYTSLVNFFSGVVMPPNSKLFGEGASSVLLANTAQFSPLDPFANASGARFCIVMQDNTTIENLTLDGNKTMVKQFFDTVLLPATLQASVSKNLAVGLVRTYPYSIRGVVLKNVTVCNSFSATAATGVRQRLEGFGVDLLGSTDAVVENVTGYNIDGTALHLDGDLIYNKPLMNARVSNCVFYDNDWMGTSLYYAQNVTLTNVVAYGCGCNGINVEWGSNITVSHCKSYSNGRSGITTYGECKNITINSCELYNNGLNLWNEVYATNRPAEISIRSGSWYRPDTVTGIVPKGVSVSGVIRNCDLSPNLAGGAAHIYVEEDASVTVGDSIPNELNIVSEVYDSWVIKSNHNTALQQTAFSTSGLVYSGENVQLVNTPRSFTTWTPASGVALSTSLDATAKSGAVTTVSSDAVFKWLSTSLDSTKIYLVKVRYKSTGSAWAIKAYDTSTLTTTPGLLKLARNNTGKWFTGSTVFRLTPGVSYKLELLAESNGATNILIDYICFYEILY